MDPSGVPSPLAMRLSITEGLELCAAPLVSGPDSRSGRDWDVTIFWVFARTKGVDGDLWHLFLFTCPWLRAKVPVWCSLVVALAGVWRCSGPVTHCCAYFLGILAELNWQFPSHALAPAPPTPTSTEPNFKDATGDSPGPLYTARATCLYDTVLCANIAQLYPR